MSTIGIRDVRMIQRAAEQRWEINKEYRSACITKLMRVVVSPAASDRAVIAAVKALVAMDALNQKDEQTSQLQSDRNRFLEIAERLGLDRGAGGTAETGTGGGTPIVDGSIIRRT